MPDFQPYIHRTATALGVPKGHAKAWLFVLFALVVLVSAWWSVWEEKWWPLAIPGGVLLAALLVLDIRRVYFLMLGSIPISMEQTLPGGLGTDIPSEPLMWMLTLGGVFWLLQNWRSVDGRFVRHPISLLLFAHLAWMTVCTATSHDVLVSFKFLLAKGWYLAVFYFWTGHFLLQKRDFQHFVWWFFVPLLMACLWVLSKHARLGFSFEEVAYAMGPFFRNHVMYACVLAIFLPFVWYATYWYRRGSRWWWVLVLGILVFLVGINFAYTRAAYVALVAAIGIALLVRWRKLKFGLLAFALVLSIFISFVATRDNWLLFAPQYEKAVSHREFTNLLEATTKLEDISIMERVYRWVAATYMIRKEPVTGFGPGTFYFFYKNYTVASFKTYVSDNPEKSGMHNYFLMTTVEQGLVGLLFLLLFVVLTMLRGERIYHETKDKNRRRMLLAALLSFMLTNLLMLMNDFVETDKIGALFFISAAILINVDLANRDESVS
jgi:O-antigen ligase